MTNQQIDKIAEFIGYHKCDTYRPYCNCGDGKHNEPYRRDIDLDDWEIAGMVLSEMQHVIEFYDSLVVLCKEKTGLSDDEFSCDMLIANLSPQLIAEAAFKTITTECQCDECLECLFRAAHEYERTIALKAMEIG